MLVHCILLLMMHYSAPTSQMLRIRDWKRAVTVISRYLLHYLSLPRRSTSSQFPVPMWCSTNPSVTENLYSTHMLLPNC